MTTGKKASSDAGNTLRNPKATKKEKAAAASDLAQSPRHKSGAKGTKGKK